MYKKKKHEELIKNSDQGSVVFRFTFYENHFSCNSSTVQCLHNSNISKGKTGLCLAD